MLVVHTNLSAFCNASVHEKGLLILCILCNFDCFCFLSSEAFFKIVFFLQKHFPGKLSDYPIVWIWPVLGPICLQRLSASNKLPFCCHYVAS